MFLCNAATVEGGVSFWGKGVGVEYKKRIARLAPLERVIECEKAREIGSVGEEGGPYFCGR